MIFIDNKYTKYYNSIIERAKIRNLAYSIDCYTEKHHIIPKSFGGSDSKSNIIRLTAREHFICHWLLTKMVSGKDRYTAICALSKMRCASANQQRYQSKITNRVYESLRKDLAIRLREINATMVRKPISEETRRKMSIAQKGRVVSKETRARMSLAQTGKIASEETKLKISKATTGKLVSDETKARMSLAQTNRVITDEHKQKLAQSKLGKKRAPFTEEHKNKIAEARRRYFKHNKEK